MPAANAAALANLRKLEVRGRDGPVQKEVLIAWDIENARIPAGVPVEDVEKAIGNAFQYLQRRKRAAFLCAVSPESLETMTRLYGRDQVGYLTQHADLLLAPGGAKSKSTDTKIIKSIEEFINRQSQDGKSATSVLVVITGDDDYTESIRHAMDAGMDVEVLHPDGKTSCNLLTAIRGRANVWHHEWLGFLEYWLLTHHGVKVPPEDAASSERGDRGSKRQTQQQPQKQQPTQQPQKQQQPQPTQQPQKQQQPTQQPQKLQQPQKQQQPTQQPQRQQQQQPQGAENGRPGSSKSRNVWEGGGDEGKRERGKGAETSKSAGEGRGVKGAGGNAAGAKHTKAPAGPNKSGGAAGSDAGSPPSSAGGGAKPPAVRIGAEFRLGGLQAVRESDAPARLLVGACDWFLEERQSMSAFYQRLLAVASEAGCKLLAGEAMGELSVVCVDGDEPYPLRVVQSTRDALAAAINERLALVIKVMGPLFGARPRPPPPPRTAQQQTKGGPSATPCSYSSWTQLEFFLAERGVDTSGLVARGQLLPMTNAVLVVESALGLVNTPLSDGSLLVAVPAESIGVTLPDVEKAAAGDMLALRMSVSQLAAAARARNVGVATGREKRCVAEMLAVSILQEHYWSSSSSSEPS